MLLNSLKDIPNRQASGYMMTCMHEVTPSEVAMAERMARAVWMMNFQVSRFIFIICFFLLKG